MLHNAYALLIGISYEDGLDTIGDAEDIAEVLSNPELCGYPPENILLLTGEKADRDGILGAFDTLIEKADENSTIFLYYSGHGDIVKEVFHFVPYGITEGMEFEAYSQAWVTAEDIKNKINKLATRRLIFFMDCCHATGMARGGFKTREVASSKDKKSFQKLEGLAQKVDNEKGISVVASCKEEQESYQLTDDRNSLFTKHLLMALKGEHQDHFAEPYVRILEVSGYLLRVIPEIIEAVGKACDPPLDIRQEPYVNLEMYDNFILSQLPASQKPKVKPSGTLAQAKSPGATPSGSNIYKESPGANSLLLFIHGFNGEGTDSFGDLPFWLADDSKFEGWDMKAFGYSSFVQPEFGKHIWGGIHDIERICENLVTSIKYKFDAYSRVAIVAHGLGGLIAQRAILDFQPLYREKVSHLLLLGCPSLGLSANFLQEDGFESLQEIGEQGSFIKELRSDWKKQFQDNYPFELKVVAATEDLYVPMASCFEPFSPDTHISLVGDHFSLVNPKSTDDPAYQLILQSLTNSETFASYGNSEEVNLALGRYEEVIRQLMPQQTALDKNGLRQLIFALEGLDRREEALKLLENHPEAANNTDLMGIIGGRYKRNYLKTATREAAETSMVYYALALEVAQAREDQDQIYYHAINLAFLSLVFEEDRGAMKSYAAQAREAALASEDNLWKEATLGEAAMYLGDLKSAEAHYKNAAAEAGIREKISMHLNAATAYAHLRKSSKEDSEFQLLLKDLFLK